MAMLEAQAAERVIEACVRTESVRKCVFTSSLLACVWRQNYPHDRRLPTIIDESCWSDESFCRDNKVSDWGKNINAFVFLFPLITQTVIREKLHNHLRENPYKVCITK